MEIVLYQPEIPQNTGNIIRTCSVTGASLTLIKPLGFSLTSKYLKRAGLDYFQDVLIRLEENFLDYLYKVEKPTFFFSSKGQKLYTDISYPLNSRLVFGAETHGLPDEIFSTWPDSIVTLPMTKKSRCLNLSNCVAIGLYEALRQNNFILPENMK